MKTLWRLFRKIPSTGKLILVIILAVALMGGTLAVGLGRSSQTKSRMTKLRLEDLGEFATQAGYFTTVQVISDSATLFGKAVPFTASKYIFSYDGTVKAGLDFSGVSLDVSELTHTITVTAPPVKILSTEIDEDSLVIYDESRNIFSPLTLDDVRMSRTAMVDEIRAQAAENGLLDNARSNAEIWIRLFLQTSYNPDEYSIEFDWQEDIPAEA